MNPRPRPQEKGFALATAMLMVMLIATLSFGLILVINTESRVSGTDLDNTRAFYAAEAAMEKMVADVNRLYAENQNPSVGQIEALASAQPDLDGTDFSEYQIRVPQSVGGIPDAEVRLISGGPFEGMVAQIIPLSLTATARGFLSAEVRMSRDIQVAQIPVFQFGIFSEEDLSYFPGPNFDFGGRVHTNGTLFLATSSDLVFRSKITAVEGIVRAELSNGLNTTTTGRTGPVMIPTAPGGCDGSRPACRDLQENEGSRVGGASSPLNPNWENLSTSVYNGFVLTSETGARRLDLPFVSSGALPIEIIQRPPPGEDAFSLVAQSRLYNQAQIRVLLADSPGQLPAPGVRLGNVAPYASGEGGGRIFGATGTPFAEGLEAVGRHQVTPPGKARGLAFPLIDGYLLVQANLGGGWSDVTMEWLDLGISRGNPNAILRFQAHQSGGPIPDADRNDPVKYIPLNLYDAREGETRDISRGAGNSSCAIGGVMNLVELDVANLRSWLFGGLGVSGGGVDDVANNGYLLYFSDRRGMGAVGPGRPDYGFEDVVNPADPAGFPNFVLDSAEDVNRNGVLDTDGATRIGDGFGLPNGNPTLRVDCLTLGRWNRVSGPRRALRLINGGLGMLPTRPDGSGGFTVGSENPVYVQGDYNATFNSFGDPHAAAAIIADSVTLLSNSWDDAASFQDATYVGGGSRRTASETSYRVAIAAGKNISWPHPAWTGEQDYGLDGGTHNFLRYLENWSGQTLHYRGSLVSLYFSQQAVGIYKCCNAVYRPPTRDYQFDIEFLRPEKLPPATPRFRDIVNLHFQQIFSPE